MATKRDLTQKEIKMINDLLDGQLSPEKAKQAFLMIEQDSVLRAAYDKLRWTKSLLRQAPRRKVPHNFTLTRQMAKEATGFYKFRRQTFSIAGALASFLFVILLAIQLAPMGFKAAAPAMDMANEIAMMEEAAEAPATEMMQSAEEEVMEEAESFAMEAEMIEEEVAEEEYPEDEISEEAAMPEMADAVEEEMEAEPTLSAEDAAGGGMNEEQPADDEGAAGEDRMPEVEAEESADGLAMDEEADALNTEEMLSEPLPKEVLPEESLMEEEVVQKPKHDWLFLATVLAGLLAFIFIFISIRDRRHS